MPQTLDSSHTARMQKRPRWTQLAIQSIPFLLLIVGVVLTLYAYEQQKALSEANAHARFEREIERTESAIIARLLSYEDLLASMNGLFAANESVSLQQWRRQVNSLPLEQRFPGILGIGLMVPVPAASLDAFESSTQREGLPGFQVRPRISRDVYLPIQYIEPLDRNLSVLGFDINAEPAQRWAAEHARDTGQPTLTAKVTLEQQKVGEAGVVLIVPLYRHGAPRDTVQERRSALLGWVYAPINSEQLLQGILGPGSPEVNVEIYDGDDVSVGNRLYASNAGSMSPAYPSAFKARTMLDVAERTWTLGFATEPIFDEALNRNQPTLILGGGLVTSLLVFVVTWLLLSTGSHAMALAERMTGELRRSESRLRAQNEFLAALQATRLGLLRGQPLGDTLQSIVERAAELAGTRHGYLFLLEPNESEMTLRVGTGFFKTRVGDRIKQGQSVAGVVWQNGQTLVVNDYSRWPGRVPGPAFDSLKSLAGVPLRSGDKIVGVIGLGHLKGDPAKFADEDINKLAQIGELASLALENAQLFDTAQQQLAQRARAEDELRRAHDELEMRVQARTAELHESEEKYRTILENIEDGYYELDLSGRVMFYNDSIMRIFGYPKEEMLGLHYKQYVDKADYSKVFTAFNTVYRTGVPTRGVDYKIWRKDGSSRFVEASASLIRNQQGEPVGFRGIVRDVTERKQQEEALRASSQFNQEIISNAGEGIIVLDRDLRYLVWNRFMEEITGMSAAQVLGEKATDLFPHVREQGILPLYERVLMHGEAASTKDTRYYVPATGRSGWYNGIYRPQRGARGEVTGIIGVINEISERKQAEAEILRRNAELATLNEVGRALSQLTQPNKILQHIYNMIGRVLDNRNVYIALYDERRKMLSFPVYCVDGEPRYTEPRPFGEGLTEYVIRSKQTLLIPRDVEGELTKLGVTKIGSSSKSLLVTPMIASEKVLGVIAVQSYEQEDVFTPSQADVLGTIASQAAIAIENARLFAQVYERAAEVSVINEMAHIITQQIEQNQLFDTVYQQIQRLMPLDGFFVTIYDEQQNLLYYPVVYDMGQRYADPRYALAPRSNILKVLQTGETVLVHKTPEEVEAETRAADNVMGSGKASASLVFIPLKLGQRIIGVMSVQSYQHGVYGEREVTLLTSIANHVAVALENARLFEQSQKLLAELEQRVAERTAELSQANAQLTAQNEFMNALHETTLGLMNRLDLSDVLQSIVTRAAMLAGTAHGYLFQLEPDETEMVMQVGTGFFEQRVGDRIRPGQSVAGVVWHTGQPLIVQDYPHWPGRVPDPMFDQLRTLMGVPLKSGATVIGVIGLGHIETGRVISQADLKRVLQFAQLATIALDNARLYTAAQKEVSERTRAEERLRQQNEFLNALHETTLALMNRLELSDLLQSIVSRAAALTNVQHGYITLVEPDESAMVTRYGLGVFQHRIGDRLAKGQGVAGKVWELGRPLNIENYQRLPNRVPGADLDAMRAWVGVPLMSGTQVIGVIGLVRTAEGHLFHENEVELLTRFAQLACIALDNARLYMAAQQEIVERRRVEAALAQARDQALEASRLKSEFLANMSHEIRTPMNAVIGMTGLLANTKLDSRQRYFVETIRSSSDTLLTIINDILDLSKMEAGKLELEQLDFDLLSAVEEAAELLAPRAREKNLSLMTFVAPDMPPQVRGDPVRLQQVLLNLIGNAIKFTERGEVSVSAQLESQHEGDLTLRFTVKDTGIGIPPSIHDSLFEPFTQADGSYTRRYGGTGLGLSISKHLVTLMNGEIGVESEEGQGSTFWFTARFARASASIPSQPLMLDQLSDLRVLIVDDSQASRDILHRYVVSWGMRNGVAADGDEALRHLRAAVEANDPYDVALIDFVMPGMDVFTLAAHIKADPKLDGLCLILLTAFDEPGLAQRAAEAGFSAYLTKPVKQSFLFNAIANALYKSGAPSVAPFDVRAPSLSKDAVLPLPPLAREAENPILIVEDHPVNRDVAMLQLQHLGFAAHAVTNGREALEAVARTPYALVLMDCQMPNMDGYEATRAIRKAEQGTGRHTPIIAMTAHAMQGDREVCLAAGMDDYFSKPVTLEKLEEVLGRWLPRATAKSQPKDPAIALAAIPEAVRSDALPAELSPIDFRVIEDLRAMQGDGDDGFLTRLIEAFVQQATQSFAAMRDAVARGDAEALRQSAHKLKGASATLGAKGLADLCFALETQARASSLQGAREKVAQAVQEYERAKAALDTQLQGGLA